MVPTNDRFYIVPPSEVKEIKPRRTRKAKRTQRDEILEEIMPMYHKALNSGTKWIQAYNDLIVDYILTKIKK